MSLSCIQIWAIIRRYFTVMAHYPFRSILRVVIWPVFLLGPMYYLVSHSDPGGYRTASLVMYISLVIKIATIFNIYSISDSLINDKATNMKSLMLSMGLGRFNYYCAMSICLIVLVLPVVLFVVMVAKVYLLDDSVGVFTLLALSIMFTLQLDALQAAAVSFITSSSYSFIIPTLIFFFEPLLDHLARWLLRNLSEGWRSPLLFMFCFSPYEVFNLYFNDYSAKNMADDQPVPNQVISQPLYLLLIAQIFWTLFFRLFAYWFEEVCPWQRVSAVRSFFFCLTKRKTRKSEGDSVLETHGSNSKHFETRSNGNRDVGIRISHVSKIYNKVAAVNDLSFSIYRGETTLLLGHNGAGKSTLMNVILGLLEPNYGYVEFQKRAGHARPAVGVCPQTSIYDEDLTVRQHLELFNDIKCTLRGGERRQHINQTMADVSLESHASKRPMELSGGMRRKLSLGIAFVGKSDVLILDEPSSGLDPDSRTFVWNAIRRYRSDRTVLLSTQHMEEADYLGDRIAIMSAGRIVCCGSSVYLNKLFGTGYKLRIECKLSNQKQILDHITNNYFDDAKPIEVGRDSHQQSDGNAVVDLTLELKLKDKSKDSEEALIRLLEDFEKHSESLPIRSYGLKSSSIEDVMLNTSRYFASIDSDAVERHENSIGDSISTLTAIRNQPSISPFHIARAIIAKHIQVHCANLFSVLLLKIVLPILGTYLKISDLSSTSGLFWQTPSVILITGHLIYYPVRERTSKFKIMQSTSNSTMLIYWVAQFLFDIVWIVVPLISANIFTAHYVVYHEEPMASIHILVTLATVCFYLASAAFCYCLSNVISNARSSVGYLIIISTLSLAIVLIIHIIRISLLKMKGSLLQEVISYIGLLILPSDAYSYFFYGLTSKCYVSNSPLCKETDGFSPVVVSFIVMLAQTIAYFSLLAFIEAQKVDIEWYFRFKNIFWCLSSDPINPGENRQVDEDVVEETAKALTAVTNVSNPSALVAARLNKSYLRSTKIIENLSFAVNRGECFGLLGVNGAGKTTTFSMVATEVPVDSGRIRAGKSYQDDNLQAYRKCFGYDPQATPELSLSPYQALYLMARLRGIEEASIPKAIDSVLHLLEMKEHAHKNDSNLSGGTKRKLALGMALIGNPAILVLDEPTAGVDPVARRGIWQLLKSLRTRNESSIIISSHAMEECEAICDRITIMARGRLRCIGTFLHLRSKFAKGCTLRVQFGKILDGPSRPEGSSGNMNSSNRRASSSSLRDRDKLVDELQTQMAASIGASTFSLTDRNANSVTFNITDNRVRRSILFRMMRDFRKKHPTVSYMINDSSLEDIFISLAREQQQLEV